MAIRDDILNAIKRTPQLSSSASRLLELSADPEHELAEIGAILRQDAALTAKVIKVVNSPVYGLLQEVTSVERAIQYLGERTVISIALENSAGYLLESSMEGYEAHAGALWEHDLRTAIAARHIAAYAKTRINPELTYTAGLLHAIGKAILTQFLHEKGHSILKQLDEHKIKDYLSGEQALLHIDHTEAGALLAENWNLPESLQVAIRYHHHPDQAPAEYQGLVYTVHLGCIVAMMGGSGTGLDSFNYRLDQNYPQYLDLTPDNLALIMLEVEEEFQQAQASLPRTDRKE